MIFFRHPIGTIRINFVSHQSGTRRNRLMRDCLCIYVHCKRVMQQTKNKKKIHLDRKQQHCSSITNTLKRSNTVELCIIKKNTQPFIFGRISLTQYLFVLFLFCGSSHTTKMQQTIIVEFESITNIETPRCRTRRSIFAFLLDVVAACHSGHSV